MANQELQQRVDALITAPADHAAGAEQFSHFREDHLARSAKLAGDLIKTAEQQGPEVAVAQAERSEEIPGVVKNAVKLMVTHSPRARRELSVPSVHVSPADDARRLEAVAPFEAAQAVAGPALAAQEVIPVPNPATEPPSERALDWYRQDPQANDHHSHWHTVYPGRPPDGQLTQKRQGELFLYMHQQMMARYATERIVAGLLPAVPFSPVQHGTSAAYDGAIVEGYGLPGYTTRTGGEKLHDTGDAQLADLASAHKNLEDAISSNKVNLAGSGTRPLTPAILGAATEASEPRDPDAQRPLALDSRYGSFHNTGHVLTAEVNPVAGNFPGVMYFFETAICDPFFYRWHGHIDDLYAEYQGHNGTNQYDQFAANVRFRGHDDIALIPSSGLQAPGGDFNAWAVQTFGEDPATFGPPASDELLTRFVASSVTIPWLGGKTIDGAMLLQHDPFLFVLRIENLDAADQDVTVRLFLAHEQLANDRRHWIELDKFRAGLKPGVNLIAQPDARSSVIKRKGVTAPGAAPEGSAENPLWCDCGWPYRLLLPSGLSTPQGSTFRLMAAVTDHALDHANDASTCGSMSFCGAEDDYPDARAMGYPFDKPFPNDDPAGTIGAHPSMTIRNLRIRCADPHPGSG